MADAGRQRIVDVGVAQRTLNADRTQVAGRVESTRQADDGIEPEQRERRAGIVEVDLAGAQLVDQRPGQRVGVDLQADGQRQRRADARADAAILLAGDGLVQP